VLFLKSLKKRTTKAPFVNLLAFLKPSAVYRETTIERAGCRASVSGRRRPLRYRGKASLQPTEDVLLVEERHAQNLIDIQRKLASSAKVSGTECPFEPIRQFLSIVVLRDGGIEVFVFRWKVALVCSVSPRAPEHQMKSNPAPSSLLIQPCISCVFAARGWRGCYGSIPDWFIFRYHINRHSPSLVSQAGE
jgi:hypothetical protein